MQKKTNNINVNSIKSQRQQQQQQQQEPSNTNNSEEGGVFSNSVFQHVSSAKLELPPCALDGALPNIIANRHHQSHDVVGSRSRFFPGFPGFSNGQLWFSANVKNSAGFHAFRG